MSREPFVTGDRPPRCFATLHSATDRASPHRLRPGDTL